MKFISRYRKLTVHIKSPRYSLDTFGNKLYVAGLTASFNDYGFETTDENIAQGLKNHPDYGIDFWAAEKHSEEEYSIITNKSEQRNKELTEEVERLVNACPHCAKKCENLQVLKAHIKLKHPDKA